MVGLFLDSVPWEKMKEALGAGIQVMALIWKPNTFMGKRGKKRTNLAKVEAKEN